MSAHTSQTELKLIGKLILEGEMLCETGLHVGAGKAGSSAIQRVLADNATRLARRGVLVPDNDLGTGLRIDGTHVVFFDGLLPEGWLLELICASAKIDKNDKFRLLLHTGQDPVGAVSIKAIEE